VCLTFLRGLAESEPLLSLEELELELELELRLSFFFRFTFGFRARARCFPILKCHQ